MLGCRKLFPVLIIPFPVRAGRAVEEDGMWRLEDGSAADSSKNHKNWTSGGAKNARFISKFVELYIRSGEPSKITNFCPVRTF